MRRGRTSPAQAPQVRGTRVGRETDAERERVRFHCPRRVNEHGLDLMSVGSTGVRHPGVLTGRSGAAPLPAMIVCRVDPQARGREAPTDARGGRARRSTPARTAGEPTPGREHAARPAARRDRAGAACLRRHPTDAWADRARRDAGARPLGRARAGGLPRMIPIDASDGGLCPSHRNPSLVTGEARRAAARRRICGPARARAAGTPSTETTADAAARRRAWRSPHGAPGWSSRRGRRTPSPGSAPPSVA